MGMAKILLASSLALAACGCATNSSGSPSSSSQKTQVYDKPSSYTESDLVWEDNFDGDKLNMDDWNFEFHEPGWVNKEWQSYDDSSENTYLKDGCLVIQALKKGKFEMGGFTSGRVNTQGKHAFTYGRFESRLKVPKGQGFLPAFWMMPDDESNYGQWPKCGEIDIMEVMGQETNKLYGTIHFGEPHGMSQGIDILKDSDFHDEFHTFAVEWEPGEIRWYCDDVCYHVANDWFTKRPGFPEITYPAPFDQPFYVIFNLAVGGEWVGYPNSKVNFDPNSDDAKMYVDYVKIYQKKSYNEDVKKPAKAAVVAKADSTGNMVSQKKGDWEFMTAGGGVGSVESDGSTHTIKSTNAGNLEYSIQYVQANVALNKGFRYRYSFDAYADKDRTIITGISAPNSSYARRFGDEKINLTTKPQHFEWEFTMQADDDAACRIEYNCGAQGSTAAIHISNVRLEKIGENALENSDCLPDGNYVKNGQFQEGDARLGEWKIENKAGAQISVTRDRARMIQIVSPSSASLEDVAIKQNNIKLEKGVAHIVKFDAAASEATEIRVRYGNEEKTVNLQAAERNEKGIVPQHFEWLYVPESSGGIDFALFLGSSGKTVWVDNVCIKENSIVMNGDFSRGKKGWELYANENSKAVFEVENGAAAVTIGKTGQDDWMIQLKQNGCLLEEGKSYRISLKAKSTLDRTIMLAMQRDGSKDNDWTPYSGSIRFDVGNDLKDYTWDFTMGKPTDGNVIFTISMGAVSGKQISKEHTVTIDSIVVEELK